MKISQRVFELLQAHKIITEGQTDGHGDYYGPPPHIVRSCFIFAQSSKYLMKISKRILQLLRDLIVNI